MLHDVNRKTLSICREIKGRGMADITRTGNVVMLHTGTDTGMGGTGSREQLEVRNVKCNWRKTERRIKKTLE